MTLTMAKRVIQPNGEYKTNKVPTARLTALARAVMDNKNSAKPKTMKEVMLSVGYAPTSAITAKQTTELVGYKVAMRELGLTEGLITSSLVTDIENKEGKRLGELRLGAELLGMVKREDDTPRDNAGNTYNFLFNAETQADVKAIEERIKARLTQSHDIQTD